MNVECGKCGTVYLVGAGPGHPGLITRLGYELLQGCDAVAYDALIPLELIVALPERIERHYVGKRMGKHSQPQEDINHLLVELARRGLNVVRLKGGDPSIFGRAGEEASCLAAAGIPVVVVPGVTAASAAAAMSGFSLTDRRASSWVLLGTGHGAECSSFPVPWDQIAALPGGTIVLYMGLARLDQVAGELVRAGLPQDTPSAAVQCASTGLQKIVYSPLQTLSDGCRSQGLKPPAVVFIGEVVRHRLHLESARCGSLNGVSVLVTSPSQQALHLCARIRELGGEPIPHPTAAHCPADDTEGWAGFERAANSGGVCLFSDEASVRFFFDGLSRYGLDVRSLGRFRIVAVGQDTAQTLTGFGIRADEKLEHSDPPGSTEPPLPPPDSESSCLVWIGANPEEGLQAILSREWTQVIYLTAYSHSVPGWERHWTDALIENPPNYIIFTGAMEVEGFVQLSGRNLIDCLRRKSLIVTMNASAAVAAHRHGLNVALRAKYPDMNGLLDAIVGHLQQQLAQVAEI